MSFSVSKKEELPEKPQHGGAASEWSKLCWTPFMSPAQQISPLHLELLHAGVHLPLALELIFFLFAAFWKHGSIDVALLTVSFCIFQLWSLEKNFCFLLGFLRVLSLLLTMSLPLGSYCFVNSFCTELPLICTGKDTLWFYSQGSCGKILFFYLKSYHVLNNIDLMSYFN